MNFVLNGSTPQARRAFIKKPVFQNFNTNNLKYLDVLTYVAIKSFDNPEQRCFPSYETIADKSGLSRTFTVESVDRLETSKYLSVYREKKFKAPNRSYPNRYSFPDYEEFNQVPLELLSSSDLTSNEKAMLLLLKQFSNSPKDIIGSITTFADDLGLSYQTIRKQYNSLVNKGYLDDSRLKSKLTKLLKIDWSFPDYLPIKHRKQDYDTSNLSLIIT